MASEDVASVAQELDSQEALLSQIQDQLAEQQARGRGSSRGFLQSPRVPLQIADQSRSPSPIIRAVSSGAAYFGFASSSLKAPGLCGAQEGAQQSPCQAHRGNTP